MVVALQTLIDRSVKNMGAVHPRVKEYAVELIKRAYKEGIYVQISSGYRSNAEQQRLYNQGRTTPGNIVTNAKPGQSVHNYGLAIDFFLVSDDGNTALWTVNAKWRRVAAIGKSMGFQWGGDWKDFVDYPHLDMQKGLSLSQLAAGKRPTIPPLSNVTPVVNDPWAKGYLQAGDHGPAIGQLQKDLNAAGANPQLAIDNNFGVAVKNRVITFQKQNGLAADGVYGKASVSKMKTVLANLVKLKPKPVPEVSGNSTEKDVEILELAKTQREELAKIFKKARERGVFTSTEHEKAIVAGTMSVSRLLYLQSIIAGAALNGGKRIE